MPTLINLKITETLEREEGYDPSHHIINIKVNGVTVRIDRICIDRIIDIKLTKRVGITPTKDGEFAAQSDNESDDTLVENTLQNIAVEEENAHNNEENLMNEIQTEQFQFGETIGEGNFGKVKLAKDIHT
ncbi:unnamed protein product [Lupinus luteus]|uniref:Uncharacterized protein n=1 Tax=Lupinus luteus TaxID=3873 RepID=A0AAV1W6K5_LUPLU